MAIEQVIAGHYVGTYNSVGLGYTKEGYALHFTTHAEKIDQTDAYGRTLIDLIYQGADVSIVTEARLYKAGTIAPFWPWTSAFGAIYSALNPMGTRGTDLAKALVLTATSGTPAATSPATATGTLAILSPENDQTLIFSSVARSVPLKWDLLPLETSVGGFLSGAYTISNAGSGYTSVPTVSFSGGGGTGATASAIVSTSGTITGLAITGFGNGYATAPTVGFSGGGGSGAAATVSIVNAATIGTKLILS